MPKVVLNSCRFVATFLPWSLYIVAQCDYCVILLIFPLIRQNDRNERQQRQLESMRRLQFSNATYGKVNIFFVGLCWSLSCAVVFPWS